MSFGSTPGRSILTTRSPFRANTSVLGMKCLPGVNASRGRNGHGLVRVRKNSANGLSSSTSSSGNTRVVISLTSLTSPTVSPQRPAGEGRSSRAVWDGFDAPFDPPHREVAPGIVVAMTPLVRLSPADLTNLATEARDTPMHQAVLAALEGGDLVDAGGRVRIDAIRAHVESRLERLPELRWTLRRTHLFEGRPLWVDDPHFRIEEHVLAATLPAPGGETAAMKFAERQMETRMDRSRPLWEMWFLDGYARDKVGLLIKLHHAMADGPAMVRLLGQLLDIESRPPERPRGAWHPAPSPTLLTLVRDNFAREGAALGRALSRLHPARAARSTAVDVRASLKELRQA